MKRNPRGEKWPEGKRETEVERQEIEGRTAGETACAMGEVKVSRNKEGRINEETKSHSMGQR